MDFTFLQPVFLSLASVAITAGTAYGCAAMNKWMGVTISKENEEAIRRAATTEAGKLVTTGTLANPQSVAASASKVLADLPHEITAERYTHNDVIDMIVGVAGTVFPPIAAVAPLIKIGESLANSKK